MTGSPSRSSNLFRLFSRGPKFTTKATCGSFRVYSVKTQKKIMRATLTNSPKKAFTPLVSPNATWRLTKLSNSAVSFKKTTQRRALMTTTIRF